MHAAPLRCAVRLASEKSSLATRTASSATRSSYKLSTGTTRLARQPRRLYATGPSSGSSSSSTLYIGLAAALVGAGGAYAYTKSGSVDSIKNNASNSSLPAEAYKKDPTAGGKNKSIDGSQAAYKGKQADYQAVYNEIARRLVEQDDYDDGSYGPVLVRLAWHCSGTYDKDTGTGGSNGATMRFDPEGDHGANAGLKAARDFLEPVKQKFPWITYSDLWTLAGICSLQEMSGPVIPWRPGRADRTAAFCTPDGRLPDGAKGSDHLRAIFHRMGFDDREIVALSGAHALGRCHTDRSGFEGPWSFSPTVLSNDYFRLLLSEKWGERKWDGPKQYQDAGSKSLMMLPTDLALIKDGKFLPHVKRYAKDANVFFQEFSDVVVKLFELGVPFDDRAGAVGAESSSAKDGNVPRMTFKPTTEQE